ncbi:MAG: hypothetical protein LBM59_02480 [Ruminococcus sp.]|jgi:hypothetical protein|nr:hypothetical protein [Ruminococcus sp.]
MSVIILDIIFYICIAILAAVLFFNFFPKRKNPGSDFVNRVSNHETVTDSSLNNGGIDYEKHYSDSKKFSTPEILNELYSVGNEYEEYIL